MTLIAGFITGDAVVLSADSEEVVSDYSKSSTQKIRSTNYYGKWHLAIGGAGNAAYIDLFQQKLSRKLSPFHTFEYAKIVNVIEATLHEIHKKHIWPRVGEDRVNASFQTLIAIQGIHPNPSRSLLVSEDSALLQVDGVTGFYAIGVGSHLAKYLIERFTPDYGRIYNMPTEQVMNLAVHVHQQVKKGIQGVDGETNVLVLYGNGTVRWMVNREVAQIEQWLDAYHGIQLPLMLAVANPHLPDEAFERISKTFTTQIENLRNMEVFSIKAWEAQLKAWEEERKREMAKDSMPSASQKSEGQP